MSALTLDQARMQWAALSSFRGYAGEFWTVPSKTHGAVRFRLNPAQRIVDEEFERQYDERGYVRMNNLKCRQVGDSTYWRMRALHWLTIRPHNKALAIAHEQQLPKEWLHASRKLLNETPVNMRPYVIPAYGNCLRLSNESSYYIGSAQGGFPGMGHTLPFLHISEIGRWDKPPISMDPRQVLQPLEPALPSGQDIIDTVQVRESTGVMRGDYWFKTWQAGKERDQEYVNVFLPWFLVPEYRRDDLVGDVLALDEYERDLVRIGQSYEVGGRKHPIEIDHAQLAWRRVELRKDVWRADPSAWSAEFPATEDEAFQSPGQQVYSADELAKARATVRKPVWRGEIIPADNPREFQTLASGMGPLCVLEWPERGRHYAIGADCQWGEKADVLDYDSAYVECVETGKVVAWLWGRWRMDLWSKQLASLGWLYRTEGRPALLAPERNGEAARGVILPLLGQAANNWSYPNLYVRNKTKKFGVFMPEDFGWLTSLQSKPELVMLSHSWFGQGFDWADESAVDELSSIVRRADGGVGAPEGSHDDKWMSRLITRMAASDYRAELMLQPIEETREGLSDTQRKILDHIERMDARERPPRQEW